MLFDIKNEWFFPDNKSKEYNVITEDMIDKLLSVADEEDAWCNSIREDVEHKSIDFKTRGSPMLLDEVFPQYISGTLFYTRYGETIIMVDNKRHFYRGECRIYPCTLPSLNRKLKGLDTRQQELYRAVANLRITQFSKFIWNLTVVQHWQKHFSDVNYKALAQHYGFDTHLLDLTNDFRVALFFATCKFNPDTNSYAPLAGEDIEKSDDSKYGVIYHSPNSAIDSMSFRVNAMWMHNHQHDDPKVYSFDSGELDGMAFQLIHQPLKRCSCQSSYIFPMRNDFPLQKDNRFEKLRFRQSPELSQRVFQMMDDGKKLFPKEGILEAMGSLDLIKKATVFSQDDVADVYSYEEVDKTIFPDLNSFRKALVEMDCDGRKILIREDEVEYPISTEVRDRINVKYEEIDSVKQFGGRLHRFITS